MIKELEKIILEHTGAKSISNTELVQTLWSGYGELLRLKLDDKAVILKYIDLNNKGDHPKGWNSDISQKRKIESYKVEFNWYKNYSSPYFPNLIACGEYESKQYLILEDLLESNFKPKMNINYDEVKMCLTWLAKFHKSFMNYSLQGIWNIGTYWNLDTRPDELEALDDLELKNIASSIDQKLNSSPFKTIVHGDAKLANFLFTNNEVKAVDFQYVGGGVGIKDVIYFLSSVYNEEELFENEEKCLKHYFREINDSNLEKEYRELYPYAWVDLYRFLKGWDPGHYKINSYIESMKQKVINELN